MPVNEESAVSDDCICYVTKNLITVTCRIVASCMTIMWQKNCFLPHMDLTCTAVFHYQHQRRFIRQRAVFPHHQRPPWGTLPPASTSRSIVMASLRQITGTTLSSARSQGSARAGRASLATIQRGIFPTHVAGTRDGDRANATMISGTWTMPSDNIWSPGSQNVAANQAGFQYEWENDVGTAAVAPVEVVVPSAPAVAHWGLDNGLARVHRLQKAAERQPHVGMAPTPQATAMVREQHIREQASLAPSVIVGESHVVVQDVHLVDDLLVHTAISSSAGNTPESRLQEGDCDAHVRAPAVGGYAGNRAVESDSGSLACVASAMPYRCARHDASSVDCVVPEPHRVDDFFSQQEASAELAAFPVAAAFSDSQYDHLHPRTRVCSRAGEMACVGISSVGKRKTNGTKTARARGEECRTCEAPEGLVATGVSGDACEENLCAICLESLDCVPRPTAKHGTSSPSTSPQMFGRLEKRHQPKAIVVQAAKHADVTKAPCCGRRCHSDCVERWYRDGTNDNCPFCRASPRQRLYFAAREGDLGAAQSVLTYLQSGRSKRVRGASPSSRSGSWGTQYLSHTSSASQRSLLAAASTGEGVEQDFIDDEGRSALHLAASHGHVEIARELLNNDCTSLCVARRNRHDFAHGGGHHIDTDRHGHDRSYTRPEYIDCSYIDIDLKTHAGDTALSLAAESGSVALVELLLERGADADVVIGAHVDAHKADDECSPLFQGSTSCFSHRTEKVDHRMKAEDVLQQASMGHGPKAGARSSSSCIYSRHIENLAMEDDHLAMGVGADKSTTALDVAYKAGSMACASLLEGVALRKAARSGDVNAVVAIFRFPLEHRERIQVVHVVVAEPFSCKRNCRRNARMLEKSLCSRIQMIRIAWEIFFMHF